MKWFKVVYLDADYDEPEVFLVCAKSHTDALKQAQSYWENFNNLDDWEVQELENKEQIFVISTQF